MKPKVVTVQAQTTKVFGPNGELIEASLDDMIKNARKITLERNFIPGSAVYNTLFATLKATLNSACLCTIELLKVGASGGGIDVDKYQLLSGTTKSFGQKNDMVNAILLELADERLQDQKDRFELDMDDDKENPLTDSERAILLAEPTKDADTQKATITTKDGFKWNFDKVGYTISFIGAKTGEPVVVSLAPEGSWRNTALKWIESLLSSIKDGAIMLYGACLAIADTVIDSVCSVPSKVKAFGTSIKDSWNKPSKPIWSVDDNCFYTVDSFHTDTKVKCNHLGVPLTPNP